MFFTQHSAENAVEMKKQSPASRHANIMFIPPNADLFLFGDRFIQMSRFCF